MPDPRLHLAYLASDRLAEVSRAIVAPWGLVSGVWRLSTLSVVQKLYGAFDVGEGTSEAEFSAAFSAFRDHLVADGFITGGRMLRRRPHDNYESNPPELSFIVELDFADEDQAERCWDYIEDPTSAGQPVHHAMISLMGNYWFALYEDLRA